MEPTLEEQRLLDVHLDRAFMDNAYMVRLTVRDRFIDDGDVAFLAGWIGTDVKVVHKVTFDGRILKAYVRQKLQDKIDESGG